jgi:putative ABC transport system permease protein
MMRLLRRIAAGLKTLVRRTRAEQDLDDELHDYLARAAEHKQSAGMTGADARRAARLEMGSIEATKDRVRDVGWEALFETLMRDIRHAARTLAQSPGFTVIAVLTLALGIGATTATFSIVNAVLWRPSPYPNAPRIVQIVENVPAEESFTGRAMRLPSMSPLEFDWWRRNARSFELIAVTMPDSRTAATADGTVLLNGARVSPALFAIRNVPALLGRGLYADEERPDSRVVALGAHTWRRHYGADPGIINRNVILAGQSYTVVGVMPPEFGGEDFWIPYIVELPRPGTVELVRVTSLLREGVSLEQAAVEVTALGTQLRGGGPGEGGRPRFELALEQDQMVAGARPSLRVLVVAVSAVLLIVCANVTNLMLVRGAGRRREVGVRRALGATRGRVIRQLLTEGVVLSFAGGVLGVMFAYGAVSVVRRSSVIELPGLFRNALGPGGPIILPRADEAHVDLGVLAFTLGLSLATGILFALAPAVRLSRADNRENLSASLFSTRGGSSDRRSSRVGHALAVLQIALATTLLIGGGLLLHSFVNLSSVFLGFDAETQIFQLVNPREYPRSRKLNMAYDLVRRLGALPGVEAAGFVNAPPLLPASARANLYLPPEWEAQRETLGDEYRTSIRGVSPDYLRAMGVRLLDGRWLDERDGPGRPQVMLVNRAWVEKFSPNRSPIGTSVVFVTMGRIRRPISWEVVGIVENVRLRMESVATNEPGQDLPLLGFMDLRQLLAVSGDDLDRPSMDLDMLMGELNGGLGFAVRTTGQPLTFAELRRVARDVSPAATVEGVATMGDVFSGIIGRQRFYAIVAGIFGTIAALIAAIGIYGVLAYAMSQRTQEFGIRLALGARPRAVLRLVLGQGIVLVLLGILSGIAGAISLSSYLSSMLFGLTPLDAVTYIAVSVLFSGIALFAAYVPARRATKVDPLIALRYE